MARSCALAACLLLILAPALASAQSVVEYTVRFDASWSEATHPINFPANPHFSGLIGGTHNTEVDFWALGELASPGIKSMAETGSKALLQGEVEDAITTGTAVAVISGGGISLSPGSVSVSFAVGESHPRVTLVSMLAPSPDWFVGVAGLDLREGGAWLPQRVVELVVYDAGTDSGTNYSSSNQPTVPPIPIYEKTEVPFAADNVVGTFTFDLVSTGAPWGPELGGLALRSLGPNPTRGASVFEVRAEGGAPADLSVYDTRGRRVRTLLAGERVERRSVDWDGRDAAGRPVPTGVYFVRLRAGAETRSAKLLILR